MEIDDLDFVEESFQIDVEKGLVSSTEVEIRSGLSEGQNVILNN